MVEGVIYSVIGGAILVGAMIFGAGAYDNSWVNDCDALGKHRSGNTVYICHKQ